MSDRFIYPRNGWEIARVLCSSAAWRGISCHPRPNTYIDPDFFGINVAASPDDRINAFVLDRIVELGLRQVRMDLSYGETDGWQRAFLNELLARDLRVMLRLVQPVEEAEAMPAPNALDRWSDFLSAVSEKVPLDQLEAVEIGAVPNRKKWSGYTHAGYLAAWQVAYDALEGVQLAGPNVSDFEPLHAILLLNEMQRSHCTPDIQTVNLFVERVREPEAFDHRVMGERMRDRLQLNLIKKSGIFAALSARYGASKTMCTHTCWNRLRLERWSDDIEQVRSAYLERYLVLAAAGGNLQRVYWGPLVGYGDGLIDDGTGDYHPVERVGHYARTLGVVENYTVLPAFEAYKQLIARLSGATFCEGDAMPDGVFDFAFEKGDASFRMVWQRDGGVAGRAIEVRD